MFPIEVEAVEVVGKTEYQCDIRGAITDLGTVLAGMETSCHVSCTESGGGLYVNIHVCQAKIITTY